MRQLVILLSIVAVNNAIRVPTWDNVRLSYKEIKPRRTDVFYQKPNYSNQQYGASLQPLNVFISPTNNGWAPLLPKSSVKIITTSSKPKYYKKSFSTQNPKKKKYFNKPLKSSSTKISVDNKNVVPYITYKKPNDAADFFIPPSAVNHIYNAYPQIPTKPVRSYNAARPQNDVQPQGNVQTQNNPNFNLPVYTNFDQSFNLLINPKPETTFPSGFSQSIPTAEESFVPSIPLQQNFQINNFNDYEPIKNNIHFLQNVGAVEFTTPRQEIYQNNIATPKKNEQEYYSHLYKNYRDDKNYEPEENDAHYIKEEDQKFEREDVEKVPVSSHEFPAEIPTKPIYPGQGLWAKPGLKHRPFISQQTYEELEEDKVKPEGYDTFTVGEQLFDKNKNKFSQNLEQFPHQHKFITITEQNIPSEDSKSAKSSEQDGETNEEKEENSEESEEKDDEFVPTRLYAQVRASENTEHLPEDDDDGRLREAIKESKVHTVYTEEGYEDSAYDHAGHEKEAENDEGFEDSEREKLQRKEKKVPHKKYNLHLPNYSTTKFSNGNGLLSDEQIERLKQEQLGLGDTDTAGTQFEELGSGDNSEDDSEHNFEDHSEDNAEDYPDEDITTTKPPRKQSNNYISTKETKTMTTKEKDDGHTETEISSKVKTILQPTNSTQSQKYVKVYPKVYKTIQRSKINSPSEELQFSQKQNNAINFSGIFIEEIIPTTGIPFTKLPSTQFEDLQEEIPITTLPTTAIPKPLKSNEDAELEALDSINNAFLKINPRKRVKRYTNDFSNIRLDAQFLPLISHQLGKVKDNTKVKYPYYNNYEEEGIDENSPLRYSESLQNIPKKTGKRMIFYEEAERKVACPEIEATLNPLPEKVLKAEQNKAEDRNDEDNEDKNIEESKVVEQQKSPRLVGLGNQIDCLKTRYFGENPFDSPFFGEEIIGPLTPIFNDLKPKNVGVSKQNSKVNEMDRNNNVQGINTITDKLTKTIFKKKKYHMKISDQFGDKTATTQDTPKILKYNEDKPQEKHTKIQTIKEYENEKVIPSTPQSIHTISLITTPKYTVTLKPNHIYHQIELLKYLPDQHTNNISDIKELKSKPEATEEFETLDEDKLTYESSHDIPMLPEVDESGIHKIYGGKRPPFLIFDVNKFLPNRPNKHNKSNVNELNTTISSSRQSKKLNEESDEDAELPEAEELRRLRKVIKKRPPFQIFDINKFLPTTPFPILNEIVTTSTVLPKYKVLSEVFYKDDIKPNEQLHVFTDILNNIKNSSHEQHVDASLQSSEPISVTLDSNKGHSNFKVTNTRPMYQYSYLQAYGDQEVDVNYYASQITTTTTAPTTTTPIKPVTYRGSVKHHIRKTPSKTYSVHRVPKPDPALIRDREEKFKLYLALLEAKKHPQYTTNKYSEPGQTIPVTETHHDFIEKTTKVMGLLPPGTQRYKTIHHPKRDNSLQISNPGSKIIRINKYFVIGMRPPPKQRIIVYSDFINNNVVANNKNILIRGKRSTSNAAYASVSRNRAQQQEELEKVTLAPDSDDDDYVPHRPKNYYYDEKTGKIIYLTTKKPQQIDEEEEVEYEEIIEEPPPSTTSKPKQDPIFATATPPPEGKGFMDFVKKLKQAPGYKLIPDPTTTEKSQEKTTHKATTLKPESTTPPEFLNILAKVRQNNQYKLIEDKKSKSTTTETPEEIVDEEYEDELLSGNVQNSPGGENIDPYEQLGIFDVTDFIPKIKNYLPKTSYDISKYKTIARPTSKPKPDIEDDAKDDEEETRPAPTTQKPFLIITEEASNIDSLNEATVTKETEKIPVVLQRRRLTTTGTTTTTTDASTTAFTTTSTEKPTTKSLLQYRRRRPTTLRSTRTTRHTTTTPIPISTDSQVTHAEKVRQTFRRRPTRIRNEPTSPKYLNEEDEENTTKVLRRRSDSTGPTTPRPKSSKFVEAFKMYHRNKKLGGSYKKAENPLERSGPIENATQSVADITNIHEDVEIISDFDKNKRHGGNYRKIAEEELTHEKEDTDNDYEIIDTDAKTSDGKPLLINLLPKYNNEDKKTGENIEDDSEESSSSVTEPNEFSSNVEYREQSTDTFPPSKPPLRRRVVNNKYKKLDKNQKRKYAVTEPTLMRLTDVVPKPEAFYKDPTLPGSVNMLVGVNKLSSDEITHILSSTESGDNTEEVKTLFRDAPTKKPSIVKDPSKRLYYYAPI